MRTQPGPEVVWVDGALSARSPDPGLLTGLGVFETLTMLRGVPFALTRHVRRMQGGARRLHLPPPPRAEIEAACAQVGQACRDIAVARLRLTWTPGPSGSGRLLATAAPYAPAATVAVALSPYRRNPDSPLAGIKATSYAENVLALARARAEGADEAILADTGGRLSEGATSNVFVEVGGELLTPPLSTGCLPGVTRGLCLEWGAREGLPIREADLPLDVMNTTAHAALTSALKGVMPVRAVGARRITTGPLTRELAAVYRRNRARWTDP